MKEVRGLNLVKTVRKCIPNVGYIKSQTERQVTVLWRNILFVISSRLTVKEAGFGGKNIETSDSLYLQEKLRTNLIN